MNELPSNLERPIRIALASIAITASVPNISSALYLRQLAPRLPDLLGNYPLPLPLAVASNFSLPLLVVSCLIPVAALATFFVRRLDIGVYMSAAIACLVILQISLTSHAWLAVFRIFTNSSGGGFP